MAYFANPPVARVETGPAGSRNGGTEPGVRRRRRGWIGWSLLALAVVLGLLLSFLPAPYLIEQPGPVFNTLGTNPYDGKSQPLITVSGHATYPTSGSLNLLTVSVVGNQTQRPSWLELVGAWLDPSKAVIPVEEIYPTGVSNSQVDQQNTADMVNAQQSAVAAALVHEGTTVGTTLTVSAVAKGSPAAGKLEKGDTFVSVNGTDLTKNSDVDTLRALLAKNGSKAASVVVERDGTPRSLSVTPEAYQGSYLLGVGASVKYDFPYDVTLKLADVGGPSAGMMFALGVIDKTTPGKLNGGKDVAGTGTIDAGGTVGAIGGIRQKLYGAKDAGATVFLAPASNCNEVTGHIPAGLSVYAVTTLSQAVSTLQTISSGGNTSKLATCATK